MLCSEIWREMRVQRKGKKKRGGELPLLILLVITLDDHLLLVKHLTRD
jgi:hypothetical protein